jgi:antirestriction protein
MRERFPQPAAELEPQRQLQPRIYVASLADYNAGRLYGTWLDAEQEPAVLEQQVQAMLAASPEPGAEEFAVHDHDDFGQLRLDEYVSLDTVSRLARGIRRHGRAFSAFAGWLGTEQANETKFENSYRGTWDSVQDYAEQMLDDLGVEEYLPKSPQWLASYVTVDVAGFARDLELGGDIYAARDELVVHIFDAHDC